MSETRPRRSQPATSSMAAALMVSAAVRECERPSSMKIRPRMGMAVIDMAMAKNSGKPSEEPGRGDEAQRERRHDAETAHQNDRSPSVLELRRELELETHLEHQEHEANLRDGHEGRRGLGVEQPVHRNGKESAEATRAEQEAGEDLAGHLRLPAAPREYDHHPRHDQDREQLVEHVQH